MRIRSTALVLLCFVACGPPDLTSPACETVGEAPPGDVTSAAASCRAARARWDQLFDESAPGGRILLGVDTSAAVPHVEGGRWVLTLRTSEQIEELARTWSPDLPRAINPTSSYWRAIPHEVGHRMLAAAAYPDGFPRRADRYGTPLPDWFDEGVATWMEPPEQRRDRLAIAARHIDELPALETLLTMEHPTGREPARALFTETQTYYPCVGECPSRPRPDARMRVITRLWADGSTTVDTTFLEQGEESAEEAAAGLYYPASFTLVAYLRDTAGERAMRELRRRLVEDATDVNAVLGLSGLPDRMDELERAWRDWIREMSDRLES